MRKKFPTEVLKTTKVKGKATELVPTTLTMEMMVVERTEAATMGDRVTIKVETVTISMVKMSQVTK